MGTVTAQPRTTDPRFAPRENTRQLHRRRTRFRWWQPGWPLTYLFTAYPLWWALGLTQTLLLVAAAVMAIELTRMHHVTARRGFGWFLLFLVWVVPGVLMLQVDAPGAVPGESSGRYITFTFRVCLYAAAAIVLLYVYNVRNRVPTVRLIRAFGWMFVTVVAGGVLGSIAPFLDFPSAMELILPRGISHVEFVHKLIHPGVAQVIDPTHPSGTPRTSAPFAYTNDWGLGFACLVPFFLVGWFGQHAGWRRYAAPWILLVAVYPLIQSQNRGLWIALAVSGVVVVIRLAVMGQIKFAVAAVTGSAVALIVLLSTPLGATIIDRATNPGSEGGRATLGTETLTSVAEVSPVIGLGTTRPVQGSFYSIAGGDTFDCVGCSPPPLGTQGHFWLVAFSTGYGGLLLYLGFILTQLFRHIRLKSAVGTLGVVVLIVHLTTMVIYDTIGINLVIIFAAVGLLWREKAVQPDPRTGRIPPDPAIGAYARLFRRNIAVLAVCATAGVAIGLVAQQIRGVEHEAVTSLVVATDPGPSIAPGPGLTVDSIAQLIGVPEVTRSVERIVGSRLTPGGRHLYVTAKRSSRVLQIHVVDLNASVAERASYVAGAELIAVRSRLLRDQRKAAVRDLRAQRSAHLAALTVIDSLHRVDPTAAPLTGKRNRLIKQVESIDDQTYQLESTPTDAGQILDTAQARADTAAWLVAGSSGLMLGLLAAVLMVFVREALGRSCRRRQNPYGDLPVLGRMIYPPPPVSDRLGTAPRAGCVPPIADALRTMGSVTVLSADDSVVGCRAAAILDAAMDQPVDGRHRPRPRHAPIVLIAGPATTDRALERMRTGIDEWATPVAGVVVLSDTPVRDPVRRQHRIRWRPTSRPPGKKS